MSAAGQADAITGYIIEFDEGLEGLLSKTMPGAVWKTWEPTYADAVAHGKLVSNLSQKLTKYLRDQPTDLAEVSSRQVWSDLKATKVPRESRSKASKTALS